MSLHTTTGAPRHFAPRARGRSGHHRPALCVRLRDGPDARDLQVKMAERSPASPNPLHLARTWRERSRRQAARVRVRAAKRIKAGNRVGPISPNPLHLARTWRAWAAKSGPRSRREAARVRVRAAKRTKAGNRGGPISPNPLHLARTWRERSRREAARVRVRAHGPSRPRHNRPPRAPFLGVHGIVARIRPNRAPLTHTVMAGRRAGHLPLSNPPLAPRAPFLGVHGIVAPHRATEPDPGAPLTISGFKPCLPAPIAPSPRHRPGHPHHRQQARKFCRK